MRMPAVPPETVIAAWCEYCTGPGWSNRLVWFLYRDRTGALKTECFQPSEQTLSMIMLFKVAAAATEELTAAVKNALTKEKP